MILNEGRRLFLREVPDDDEDRLVGQVLFGMKLLNVGDSDSIQRVFGSHGPASYRDGHGKSIDGRPSWPRCRDRRHR